MTFNRRALLSKPTCPSLRSPYVAAVRRSGGQHLSNPRTALATLRSEARIMGRP